MRVTCTPEFRKKLQNIYPGLDRDPAYWRLMRRLLFSQKRDQATDEVIIDWNGLAKDEGKMHLGRNYRALPFLKRFRANVMPDFNWNDYCYKGGKARRAITKWPKDLLKALEEDRKKLTICNNRVYFTTGKPYTRLSVANQRAQTKREADKRFLDLEKWQPAVPLVQYLNNLPPHRFTKLLVNLPSAEKVAQNIIEKSKRDNQLERLACIRDQAQQFYQFSSKGKTARIFPLNAGILMLKKDVRQALTKGWWECDLRSSQLAICSKLWSVRPIEKFLATGGNIWKDFADHFEVGLTTDFKAAVKKALYSLMFGATKETLIWELNGSLKIYDWHAQVSAWFPPPPIGGREFFAHPLIKKLYTARNRRIRELINGGKIITAFGQEMECDGSRESARSILACEAQAMELWLLMPVVEMARETDEFFITLWQHDGFSLAFRNNGRAQLWLDRISTEVKYRAQKAEIITELEVTKL